MWDDILPSSLPPLIVPVTIAVSTVPFFLLLFFVLTQKEERPPPPRGCKKVGINDPSNLADQYLKKYSEGAEPGPDNSWKVKALFVYPIKSCSGVELDEFDVIRTGPRYDRQFTLAQYSTGLPTLQGKVESSWKAITQRSFPRLCQVETEIWVPDPDISEYSHESEWVQSDGCLVVRFPFSPDVDMSLGGLRAFGKIWAAKLAGQSEPMLEFHIPFNPQKDRIKEKKYKSAPVEIWKDTPNALDMSCEIEEELLAKLKYTLGVTNPLALFRIDTEKYREVYMCAPKKKDVGFQTIIGMADSYPMNIMNLAAVHDVSSRQPKGYKPLNALRFRPNVLFTGPPAFDEDDWKKARIGKESYHISCHTTRCKLPNVDPEMAIADRNEPNTTMRKYRVIDQGSKSPCLGMQVTPLTDGRIRVGDEIEVLERGDHLFLKE